MSSEINDQAGLQPIRSRRLSEIAVDQIASLIQDGWLDVGDQLPSERELVNQLAVSRASVREALRILEAQGLIQVRPGIGAFVVGTGPETEFLSGIMTWFEENREDILDVLEVSLILDGYAAWLASQCASPEQVERLVAKVAAMRSCVERGALDDAARADREFHRLMYGACGNSFLLLLAESALAALGDSRHSSLHIPGRALRSVEEHEAIVKAIASGDPEKAREASNHHVSTARKVLLALQTEPEAQ